MNGSVVSDDAADVVAADVDAAFDCPHAQNAMEAPISATRVTDRNWSFMVLLGLLLRRE
jgi:hypothetical protein